MIPAVPAPRRVLVIDDQETIHRDFCTILEPVGASADFAAMKAAIFGSSGAAAPRAAAGFRVDCAQQGKPGVEMAAAASQAGDPYRVAFVDMRMPPGWDGATTIRHLWQADPRIQVVICTAYSDTPLQDVAAELGGRDKLLVLKKPFDNIEVLQLATALAEKWDSERAAAMKLEELERIVRERTAEIEHALLHDKLTGLPNRTLLTMRLDACLQRRQRRPEQGFAVLFIDFDRFKLINDSLGHEVGDLLLIEIGTRLRDSLRPTDVAAASILASRMGGDEFIVLLEDLHDPHDAARVAERLLALLSEPYDIRGQKLIMTASIGIATSDRPYERGADMIRDADTAMYRAKAAGRSRCVMFDARMHEEAMARLSLETELRKAVRNDALELHYQPIVRLASGEVSGFEALVRWSHPQQGPVDAAQLIAVADDTGMIQPLSIQLLRKACRQLRQWQERFPAAAAVTMSVNLSRRQLLDPDLVSKIESIIQQEGVDPRNMIVEITETAVLEDRGAASEVFRRLKQIGVWLHLDDFGTGYSSLSCLYSMPISGLKIDQTFVQHAFCRREHAEVLRAIVGIARAFNLTLIAEGIETTEQFDLLRGLGIQHGQGFLFGKPAPGPNVESFLSDQAPVV